MIQHILLVTDGSSPSEQAADFAASLALRYHARLTVLHALTPVAERLGVPAHNQALHQTLGEAREIIASLRKRLSDMGVTSVETEVIEGPAPNVIIGTAESCQPDLIVIGARGQGTWPGAILGSVSAAVVQRAPCPVLVVR